MRLDKPVVALFADEELLETIATVLEAGEMPPEEAPQPKAEAVAEVVQMLQKQHPHAAPGQSPQAAHSR